MKPFPFEKLRRNPDIAALALLVALLVPALDAKPESFHLTLASRPSAERVWQRLETRMRDFERKFERYVQPETRCASLPVLSSE